MRKPVWASLITLALIAGIDLAVVGIGPAAAQSIQPSTPPSAQQGSQQEKLNLNATKEQAVTQGLANQPAQNVTGFSGQMGSKLPSSETAKPLPNDVQAQVPEVKNMLFVKLPDRVVLIDPDSMLVAEIVMAPATTGSTPAPSQSPSR